MNKWRQLNYCTVTRINQKFSKQLKSPLGRGMQPSVIRRDTSNLEDRWPERSAEHRETTVARVQEPSKTTWSTSYNSNIHDLGNNRFDLSYQKAIETWRSLYICTRRSKESIETVTSQKYRSNTEIPVFLFLRLRNFIRITVRIADLDTYNVLAQEMWFR